MYLLCCTVVMLFVGLRVNVNATRRGKEHTLSDNISVDIISVDKIFGGKFFGGQHFSAEKIFAGQKFSAEKFSADKIIGGQNFRHQFEISAVLSDENVLSV